MSPTYTTNEPSGTRVDDLTRAATAARRRRHPRRRHMTRPRDSLDDIAHATAMP